RLETTLDEIARAESGLTGDTRHSLLQARDDRLRSLGGREQTEIRAPGEGFARPFSNRRNGREQRRALIAVDEQADHCAALELRAHIGDAVEPDRYRSVEQRGYRLAAAAERHPHEIGTGVLLQALDEYAERHRGGGVAESARLCLRQCDQ